MENKVCIKRLDQKGSPPLIGPFDLPGDAVGFAMTQLGLDSSRFQLVVVIPPERPRPHLRAVA